MISGIIIYVVTIEDIWKFSNNDQFFYEFYQVYNPIIRFSLKI